MNASLPKVQQLSLNSTQASVSVYGVNFQGLEVAFIL